MRKPAQFFIMWILWTAFLLLLFAFYHMTFDIQYWNRAMFFVIELFGTVILFYVNID